MRSRCKQEAERMVDFLITRREHFAEWSEGELEGRAIARLIAEPIRTYAQQKGSEGEPSVFVVYQTKERQRHEHREALPEGLYQCYLADIQDPGYTPLTAVKRIFIGEKRSVTTKRSVLWPGQEAVRLTVWSPLALKAGECGLDYGLSEPVPLPETKLEGSSHVIRCILPRFRPELGIRLWLAPELREFLRQDDGRL